MAYSRETGVRPANQMVTTREAAELLQVHYRTIQRWIDAAAIPAARTQGGHRRVRMEDLRDFATKRGIQLVDAAQQVSPSVLLVDDEHDQLDAVSMMIREIFPNLEVLCADSGFKAGALVSQHRPGVVFLDIMMPDVDGIEVCRWIKSNTATRDAHVIGVTSVRKPASHQALLAAGAEEIILKPLRVETVRGVLLRYVTVQFKT